MALLDEEIATNKARFLDLVTNVLTRDGVNTPLLIRQLSESDFFYAPATANYYGNYPGGLCEHCLKVYDALNKLVADFYPDYFKNDEAHNTILIISLFSDFSKMNFYTSEVKNKKVYSDRGSKTDSMGRYDWESVRGYGYRDNKDRFFIGNHESTSAFMINSFIPLTPEEWCAISNHHAGNAYDSSQQNPYEYWEKYPISLLLHQADCIASVLPNFNKKYE